jgi:hypothetical protein
MRSADRREAAILGRKLDFCRGMAEANSRGDHGMYRGATMASRIFILIAALLVCGPVLARDISFPKQTAAQIQQACESAGGKLSQDAHGYGCGTDCHGGPGTDCTVYCREGERCTAQVIAGRRPHNILDALKAPERRRR